MLTCIANFKLNSLKIQFPQTNANKSHAWVQWGGIKPKQFKISFIALACSALYGLCKGCMYFLFETQHTFCDFTECEDIEIPSTCIGQDILQCKKKKEA